MNCSLPTIGRAIVALFVATALPTIAANAQTPGYQAPNFAAATQAGGNVSQPPVFPAALLAGGPAAAQGSEFMDVNGQPIVMQTSYDPSCPTGCGPEGCYPGYAGGYGGDPMAIDFGGYGQDQCGPHYFDISADVVFLQATELFDDVGAFTSVGLGPAAPRLLVPENSADDYEPGWQIAARYDIGALAVLEATYMGLYDIGFRDSVQSIDVTNPPDPNQLFSPFSNFGIDPLIAGIDDGRIHTIDLQADLQSTEISYRRYWVGNNPRISGTWLLGARYLRMTEDFNFDSVGRNPLGGDELSANRLWSSENDMVGFQFGGDGWVCLRQGLRIGAEAKSGIYNNRFKFRHAATLPNLADFDVETEGNQVAFAAEGGATIVADILPSWSIRGGYRVLYLNSLATVGGNIDLTNISSTVVSTQSHALYHGFHGGIEYIW